MSELGAVILAAGASTRLGQSKQLLVWRGKSLIARATEAVIGAGVREIVVVLGARANEIGSTLAGMPVHCVTNSEWAEGMGSSLRAGVAALARQNPMLEGVMITLCDQPFFAMDTANCLIEKWNQNLCNKVYNNKLIIASRYGGSIGVPAIFGKGHYDKLQVLSGSEGARRIIDTNAAFVVAIDLPKLAIDVDTPEDWARLQ